MRTFETEMAETFWAKIYICGDLPTLKEHIRYYCTSIGLCVNVKEVDFLYTGGSQTGLEIELINYPRFPSTQQELIDHARKLAQELLHHAHQRSCSVTTPMTTYYIKRTDI